MAILSIPVVDIAGPGIGGLWLLRKASQKKIVLKVESVGNNLDAESYLEKEFSKRLQKECWKWDVSVFSSLIILL